MVRMFDRLFLFLFSIVVGASSIALILLASGAISSNIGNDFIHTIVNTSWAIITTIIVSAVMLLLSVRFFYLSVIKGSGKPASIEQRTDYGDISISLETIENLSLKAATRVRGVKDLRTRVHVAPNGLDIRIRGVVDGETAIPALTEEVQKAVKNHVEEISGMPVTYVNVFIANIAQTQNFKSRVE